MKCLLCVCLAGALGAAAELALSNVMQSPPLQKGISVQMAVTNNASPMPDADNADAWIVTVTEAGKTYFGVHAVSLDGLTEQMKSRPRNHGQKLYIKADARASYANVQKALSAGRAAFFDAPVLLTSQATPAEPGTIVPPKGLEVLAGTSAGAELPLVRVLNPGQARPMVEIDNQRIPLTALPSTLSRALQNRESKVVLVMAGGPLRFADVVHVIDVCRGTGARVILDLPQL
jgi:biopolymer transport protein ExbD